MWPLTRSRFRFLDPGPLVDDDLKLLPPDLKYIDDVLEACSHPLTVAKSPELTKISREGMLQFIESAPQGRHRGEPKRENIPSYHFWMHLTGDTVPLKIAGAIGLRIGDTTNLRRYIGHVGYNVYPPARGRHLAERATRLLLPLARRHELKSLWITCNPDNLASRRTCERLGGELIEVVNVPPENELHSRGEVQKCRYRIAL